jgi:hypothetical protein
LETKTTREPAGTGSPRKTQAQLRLQSARHNANYVSARLADALPGSGFINVVKRGTLRPLQLRLPRTDWYPPRGAVEFIELLAAIVVDWRYSGIHAAHAQIAEALRISKGSWEHGPRVRDGKVISRGGAREWNTHHRFLSCYTTTNATRPWTEGKYFYELGPAVLELLGIVRALGDGERDVKPDDDGART